MLIDCTCIFAGGPCMCMHTGGAVASWLVRLTLDQAVQYWYEPLDTVLCSWVKQHAVRVPLSTQVY